MDFDYDFDYEKRNICLTRVWMRVSELVRVISLFFFASRSSEICFNVIARSFLNRTENRSDNIYKKWERKRKNIGHANAIKIYIFVKIHPICLYESSCLIVCFPMLPWFL